METERVFPFWSSASENESKKLWLPNDELPADRQQLQQQTWFSIHQYRSDLTREHKWQLSCCSQLVSQVCQDTKEHLRKSWTIAKNKTKLGKEKKTLSHNTNSLTKEEKELRKDEKARPSQVQQ